MTRDRAVVTLCIGDTANEFATYTHPAMAQYAEKVGADFIVYDTAKIKFRGPKQFNPILFEKYQVYDTLADHDRVLFLDTDILVTPEAPDIFEVVPEDAVGGVFEDFCSEQEHRRSLIRKVQEALGDVGWTEGFMNSGAFVVSKQHRPAFRLYKKYGFYDGEYEQTNTNWYLRKAGFDILNIDYRFNFMGLMRICYGPIHREAYFIHYAGKSGICSDVSKLDQVRIDYEYFYEHEDVPDYDTY
jgi:lipopolysaccharide biosynthesis glycosyltransferase